ncbi:MAG: response regulator [Lachnospiraceae bacterium]|nr:response regulator [Lachnospiraceae bacterium]
MKMQERRIDKVLRYCLGYILLIVLVFLVVGEWVAPSDVPSENGRIAVLEAEWERVFPDGTRESAELPCTFPAKRGETVRAEAVLPDKIENSWAYIRASQQDIRIYIDGELREEYSTKATRPFGKTSASVYVFFPLYEEDGGKVLTVETVSDSVYSGRMNQIFTGEKYDIVKSFVAESGLLLVVAFTTVIISVITVVISLILRLVHKKEVDIIFLGLGTLLTSLVLIVESVMRQFYLSNITVATLAGFLLTMLGPYPFIVYANLIQKGRYRKFYVPVLICILANTLGSMLLHIAGIVDLMDSMIVDYGVIVLAVLVGAGTLAVDIKQRKINEYREVAIGLAGIIVASFWEIYQVYRPGENGGGFAFCGALCFLLFMASLKTGRDMQTLEKERQRAIVAGEAKTQFLAQMSHEIRTPINTILGMNEMILRESEDETISEYAQNIKKSSNVLLGLINDVLDFSKIEAGKLDITEITYSPKKMLDDLIRETSVRAERKNIRLQTEISSELPAMLQGDELRVRQILTNLLSNAVKYTKNGTVTFSVDGERNEDVFWLHVSVADTGMGIREEDVNRLFDSFQRLEEKKNRHIEGTGLGLAITKQLLDLMGGSITVESEFGKGSCFTVRIPQQMILQENTEKEREERPAEGMKKKQLAAPDALVLAVDDNEMNLMVVKMLLKRTLIQVETVLSGNECLEHCRRKKYDLILMDHMMPELDGVETLHLLRKEETLNRDTKVLVLTANAIAGVAEQYEKEGFDGYLSKPLVIDDLEAMLGKHLPEEKVQWTEAE